MTTTAIPSAREVVLQPLRWWDIEELVALEELLFPADSPWTAGMFWSELANGHHYVVIKDKGRIIGYAGLARGADEAQVQTIGVDPGYQHQGIGRALMNDLLAAAAERPILLEVRTDNEPAISLYQSLGFVRIAFRRNYYQPSGADAFVMEKAA